MDEILARISHLPEHLRVLKHLVSMFAEIDGVTGGLVSGSLVNGSPDEQSDLDIGIVVESQHAREAIWQRRWVWKLEPWFHRFDADHIKPYFVIYLFEPCVKADINLYVDDLPGWTGAPFRELWSEREELAEWCNATNREANGVMCLS